MRAAIAILLVAVLGLSGCTKQSASAEDVKETTAAAPRLQDDASSITGSVTTTELQPLPGATVGLVETQNQTTTDAAGKFTFNGVAPGTYRLLFAALGYEQVGRQVEVRLGEIVHVNASLVAVALESDAYHVSIPKTSLITVDNGLVSGGLKALVPVNTTVVTDAAFCNSCRYYLHVEKGAAQILSEVVWAGSSTPMVNQNIELWYWWVAGTVTGYAEWEFMVLGNRGAHNWSAENLAKAIKKDVIVLDVTAEEIGFSFQHRVNIWTTLAYGGALAEGFTALPPE